MFQDKSDYIVDERFDDIFPPENNTQKHIKYTLKVLRLDNQTKCDKDYCKDLESDVFFFKEDIENDFNSIQSVSTIATNKINNVYIPVISPIMEEDKEAESDQDGESIQAEMEGGHNFDEIRANTVYDYNSGLIQYYNDLILSKVNPDLTSTQAIQSIDSTLPITYKHYIQSINDYF